MPKRNNPFGDHSTLQLKTHVGTKEVDKGVDQVTRMQSVYDKTHELLFSGMKGFVNHPETNNNNVNDFGITPGMGQGAVKKDNLKQMHLGSDCRLVSNDVEMDTDTVENHDQGFFSCPSRNDCHSDFMYGRTPSEHSPPGFMSAASLMMPPQQSPAPVVGGSTIFERMKQAQLKVTSKSHSVRGACHSCTRPVHSRDVMKCQFCENYVCSLCTRQCNGCFLHFCQLCSILNYNQVNERAFCFSCSEK